MVSFSSRISPFTSTVIFFDKSPRATAVVTSAMLRTWPVRLVAIAFTLSVRSAQVPATSVDLSRHRLRKIALRNRADHAGHFGGRLDHVVDQVVDGAKLAVPAAAGAANPRALGDLAFLADDPGKALEFLD